MIEIIDGEMKFFLVRNKDGDVVQAHIVPNDGLSYSAPIKMHKYLSDKGELFMKPQDVLEIKFNNKIYPEIIMIHAGSTYKEEDSI